MPKVKYKTTGFIKRTLNYRVLVFLSNFIFQGMRYMSLGERIYKLSLTALFSIFCFQIVENIYLAIFLGHSLNYFINGQFYVVYRYMLTSDNVTVDKLKNYLSHIDKLIKVFDPLDILYTGSFCRGRMSGASDLDIRIYHKPNIVSSIKAYMFATYLRFYGLIMSFPVDVYCFSDLKFLGPDKIDVREIPVHTIGNPDILSLYPESKLVKNNLELLVFV